MSEESRQEFEEPGEKNGRELASRLDAAGLALCFIWIGIAFLAHLGWNIGLLGIGVITLGGQAARKGFGLALQGGWVFTGLLLVVANLWKLFDVVPPLMPILLIVVGLGLLVSTFKGKRPSRS